jgi:hypothetical protein
MLAHVPINAVVENWLTQSFNNLPGANGAYRKSGMALQ